MGHWYKTMERKRISKQKFERVSKLPGVILCEVETIPSFRVKYMITNDVLTGFVNDRFFYFFNPNGVSTTDGVPAVTGCYYRVSILEPQDHVYSIAGCWNETTASRDWELIEIDQVVHSLDGRLPYKSLTSYRLPENSKPNQKYAEYLKAKIEFDIRWLRDNPVKRDLFERTFLPLLNERLSEQQS